MTKGQKVRELKTLYQRKPPLREPPECWEIWRKRKKRLRVGEPDGSKLS